MNLRDSGGRLKGWTDIENDVKAQFPVGCKLAPLALLRAEFAWEAAFRKDHGQEDSALAFATAAERLGEVFEEVAAKNGGTEAEASLPAFTETDPKTGQTIVHETPEQRGAREVTYQIRDVLRRSIQEAERNVDLHIEREVYHADTARAVIQEFREAFERHGMGEFIGAGAGPAKSEADGQKGEVS